MPPVYLAGGVLTLPGAVLRGGLQLHVIRHPPHRWLRIEGHLMKYRNDLTADRVRDLFDYDPLTGAMVWKVNKGGTARQGTVAGWLTPCGYLLTNVDGHRYYNHRLIWLLVRGVWPADQIDHINGVRDDNRIANLRDVPSASNGENRRCANSNSYTGVLGVSWYARYKKFTARIKTARRNVHLGYYSTPEEAHAAYLEAKRRLHAGNTL